MPLWAGVGSWQHSQARCCSLLGDPQCIFGVQELPEAAPLLSIGQNNQCSAAGELA